MKKQKTNSSQSNTDNIQVNYNPSTSSKVAGYSEEDLKEFKKIILSKLEEATNHYEFLKETLSGANDHGTDDTSPTFKLLEDASDVFSKEETALHAIRTQKFIEQLQNALIRIENKTYGICSVSGKLIPKERLKSVPHTTKSLDAKTAGY